MTAPRIRVNGVREIVRAIGKISPDLRKELGQRNKAIGQRIIDRAFPKPEGVGAGRGAKPRASASTTVLRIMAGGSHRKENFQQWGVRVVDRDVERPYILRSAESQFDQIERDYIDAILDIANKAGIEVHEN